MILTVGRAFEYLSEAAKMNPGLWIEHSKYVALAAKNIAHALDMDASLAEAYGYIHDIGRRVGVTQMRHIIDGYNFLAAEGYDDGARICMTHSFPTFKTDEAIGDWDCTKIECDFAKQYMSKIVPNEYDRLIQLCDALALPSGFTILERRLLDVSLRYGVDERTLPRWREFLKIQTDFEARIGKSIYSLLPGVEKNIIQNRLEYVL